jgi:DNA-binding NtrC family response regulator
MAKILIVEDELFIRQIADFTIEDLGHDTLLAANVTEALAHLASEQHIDAVFVDMRLMTEAFGGCEVADEAIRVRPEVRVLYTSGKLLTEEMSGHFVVGGHFLQKPYSPDQLEVSVGKLLH